MVSITINSSDLTQLNSGFLGRLRTTYHRQGNKRVAKRLWACVGAERQHLNTRVAAFDTTKHFTIPIETLGKFVLKIYLFCYVQINKRKTKEMVITSSHSVGLSVPLIPKIERVETFKLLGTVVSSDLKWNSHIAYVIPKANSRIQSSEATKTSSGSSGRYVILLYWHYSPGFRVRCRCLAQWSNCRSV